MLFLTQMPYQLSYSLIPYLVQAHFLFFSQIMTLFWVIVILVWKDTWHCLTPLRTIGGRGLLDFAIIGIIKTNCLILYMLNNLTRLVTPWPLVIKFVYLRTFILKSHIFKKQSFFLHNNWPQTFVSKKEIK